MNDRLTDVSVGRALLCSPADDNKVLLAAANPEIAKWEHEKWNMPAEWEELSPLFEGWGPHACAILEVSLVLSKSYQCLDFLASSSFSAYIFLYHSFSKALN